MQVVSRGSEDGFGFDISKWMCAAEGCRRGTNEKCTDVGYAAEQTEEENY